MKIIKNINVEGVHFKPIVTDVFFNKNKCPKKILIFCHGYKGFKDWGAWDLMAKAFANAGFFFVKFNFSHNGGTAEQPIDFPDLEAFGNNNYSKELDDLGSVIDWVSENSDIKNEIDLNDISLFGHSRGGGIVLLKSNEDLRVKKVITLAGVSDFESRFPKKDKFKKWKEKQVYFVKNGRTCQKMPHFYQFFRDFEKNEKRLNIKKATQNLEIPLLIIHGNKDISVSINEAENLHKWNSKSTFKIIDNSNHVFGTSHPWNKETLPEELSEVIEIVSVFLKG
ncbi:MAG: alpha/beta hydrolase fold domain-containing protein [Polaribacter sp.]|nr:alpha/beta hydrolase fold domain-containing protein [Polaribacter sp.]MDG2357170.1 alpha/beta hydrolase fold domain-containing protein [Polaribacter sp.]